MVEAPTWRYEEDDAQSGKVSTVVNEGGLVVEAPTWQGGERDVQDHDMSNEVMTIEIPPPDVSDLNPDLERGRNFP